MKIKTLPFIIFILISFSYALDGDMYDFFLPNGLKVILMEKHGAPKAAVSLFYHVGSHDDKEGQKGINMITRQIIFETWENPPEIQEGTSKNSKLEYKKKFSQLQAHFYSKASYDKTFFVVEVPVENIEFVLDLGSDIMQNIIITEDILNRSKDKHKADYISWHNEPLTGPGMKQEYDMLHSMIPEGHPYKTQTRGILEQFDTLSVQTCQNYLNTYFVPNNAVLIIVGDIIPEDATELIYQHFSPIKAAEAIPPGPDLSLSINMIPDNKKNIKHHISDKSIPVYSTVFTVNFIYPPLGVDDWFILEHLGEIINRDSHLPGDISKMFTKNFRQLTYGPRYYLFGTHGGGIFGVIGVNIFRNGSLNKIEKNMLKTFEFIGKNGIDEEDLNEYRKFKLLESYIDGYNYGYIAYKLGNAEIIYGDYREYNREIEILKNLSNEDIKRVVSTYLISDNMITMHVTINEKRWYTPIASFLFNQIFTRIQRPDLGIF